MRKVLLRIGLVVLVAAIALPAAAQAKVAVIEVQRVISESDPGKESLQRLRTLQEKEIEDGRVLQQELDALRDQFSKQRFTLSEDKLAEMTGQIEDKTIALQRFEDDAKRNLEEARRTALQRLEERIMPIISQLGQEQGITVIFNKYQSGLVYADETTDITDEVIRRFNTAQ